MGFAMRLEKIVRSGEEGLCLLLYYYYFAFVFSVLALEGAERAAGETDRTVW